MRLVHEDQVSELPSMFVTLTFDDEHLPRIDGVPTLDVRPWQLFAKRLRKQLGRFRFFQCGEYGELTGRPHHHAILFGVSLPDLVPFSVNGRGEPLYASASLMELWGNGHVLVGNVTFESASYVARYCMKKHLGHNAEYGYKRWSEQLPGWVDIKPEFVTMSRRPGIGSTWVDRYGDQVYRRDEVYVRGRYMRPPKYYDARHSLVAPERVDAVKRARAFFHRGEEPDGIRRLETRESVAEARQATFSRRPL